MRHLLLPLAVLAIPLAFGFHGNKDISLLETRGTATTCLSVAVWSLTVLGLFHRARR